MKFLGITVAILFLVLGGGAALVLMGAESQPVISDNVPTTPATEAIVENANVTYNDNGFQPQKITVTKGTTVNFANKTQLPMWVASAPHPEHTNYPELDAGVIAGDHIAPGNPSFSFKFDKPGTWSYHNHSAPEHEAVIIVK